MVQKICNAFTAWRNSLEANSGHSLHGTDQDVNSNNGNVNNMEIRILAMELRVGMYALKIIIYYFLINNKLDLFVSHIIHALDIVHSRDEWKSISFIECKLQCLLLLTNHVQLVTRLSILFGRL